MKVKKPSSIKKIYNFYTSGLKQGDLKNFLKQDMRWAYEFYKGRMTPADPSKNSLHKKYLFFRNLFIEFLQQLTPVRRLLYSASLFIFIWSYLNNSWEWAVFAAVMFNILLAFELADKLTARDELTVARDIQLSLMPGTSPHHSKYQIAFYNEPASDVGGDYFDFLEVNGTPDSFSIIIGDISGKGMSAALHMVQVKSIIHMLKDYTASPKDFLCRLNSSLSGIFRNGMFFTSTYLTISSDSSILLSRAGHLPMLYFKRDEERCIQVTPKGMGIGLSENGLFSSNLEQININPCKGDIILLYTDGLTETMDAAGNFFGDERLQDLLSDNAYKSVEQIKSCILDDIYNFSDKKASRDDLTFIVLKHI